MKAHPLACVFLLLLAVAVQLPAQQPVSTNGTNATALPEFTAADFEHATPSGTNAAATNKESGPWENFQVSPRNTNPIATNAPKTSGFTDSEFFSYLRTKAEKGDAGAQVAIGRIYVTGKLGGTKIVNPDFAEAVKWYRKAAEQGNADGEFWLALSLTNTNATEAVKWYRKAAEQEHPVAQDFLGLSYKLGKGVLQDYPEAAKWFQKAANRGVADAQNELGLMYEAGQGVPQDYAEAYKWYNLAASQGDNYAVTNRDQIVEFMTPQQIAEAQELSREFKPRKESGSDNSASPGNPIATGTGFFITDDGYLISNYHVVKDAAQVRLLTGAGTIPAKVVQVDTANDLALLKARGRFAALPITASRTVRLGNTVATVGFPDTGLQGFAPKLAKGEIASLSGAADDPRYFQISVPVQPGNSGGALVDERGNVIGIVSAKLSAQAALAESGVLPENVNYAVKSSFLLGFLESVPDVSAKLKDPNTREEKFEDVVKSAQQAAVLVLVY